MRAFVKYTPVLETWRINLLAANSIHLVVAAIYIIGHIHRALCADVRDRCPPFPTTTVWLLIFGLLSVISIVTSYCATFGVNTAYTSMVQGIVISDFFFMVPLVLIRQFASTGEDASFRTFALATSYALLIVSFAKVIIMIIFSHFHMLWYKRALEQLALVLNSSFMLKQLAKIRTRMNSARQVLDTFVGLDLIFIVLYFAASVLLSWSFNAAKLMTARTSLFLHLLSCPRYYTWAIYRAVVGLTDLQQQTENYGFIQMSYTTVSFLQLSSVPHGIMAGVATGYHYYFLLSRIDDLYTFEVVLVGIQAGLSTLFLVMDIVTLALTSFYLSQIVRMIRVEIPMRFPAETLPNFPLTLATEAQVDQEELEEDREAESPAGASASASSVPTTGAAMMPRPSMMDPWQGMNWWAPSFSSNEHLKVT